MTPAVPWAAFTWRNANAYGLLAIAGIVITAYLWGRITAPGGRHDGRLTLIYFCGLIGALIGAKLAFLLADGWHYRHDWLALLSGRSITGGLLGGYLAVEIAKKAVNYRQVTGDVFAIVVPIALLLGRVGCVLARCCPGIVCAPRWWTITDAGGMARWPAAPVELLFNACFVIWALLATRHDWQRGNRFHVYLVAYGLFRFGHEFVRDEHRLIGGLTGYHLMALVIAGLGLVRYLQRRGAAATSFPVGSLLAR